MTGSRKYRIVQAILKQEEIPEPQTDPEDFSRHGMSAKYFTTSDGVKYRVRFSCGMGMTVGGKESCFVTFIHYGDQQSIHSFEVLKNVLAKVRDMIREHNPDYISFVSTSKSRQKLYLALVERFFPGKWWHEEFNGSINVALGDNPKDPLGLTTRGD